MTAYLLTVGDEILIGQITDTNSAWMAQQLNQQGIRIVGKSSVGDVHSEIVEAIDYALSKADLVLMTGGLGATKDDITKKAIADYLKVGMVWSQETYDRTETLFKKFNRTVSEMNRLSCYMPDTATLLMNNRGLAPAMWFDLTQSTQINPLSPIPNPKNTEGGKKYAILVSMPGVPYEMQHLMSAHVLPKLKSEFPMSPIVHRTVLTAGEGETILAEKLEDFENSLPDNVKLAYLPSLGTVRLRLTARGADENALNEQLENLKSQMVDIVQYAVAGFDDDTMPKVVGDLLNARNLRMATAESCTGGHLSHLITAISGSSVYFVGGVVAYDNELKVDVLDVKNETLAATGAVSEETVKEMVRGAVKNFGADVAIATSGIAGPNGGTPTKPVGTIWIAAGDSQTILTHKITIDRGRAKNIEYASNTALNLLRRFLLQREH